MSLFKLTREIAIDLGTANTIIIADGQIVVEEPSVVAICKSDDKMMAVGRNASAMIGRGEDRIYLTGGGALLHGLAERLSKKMTIEFHIADDPLHSVAKGTGIALKDLNKLSF